jgi:hypothetical protein
MKKVIGAGVLLDSTRLLKKLRQELKNPIWNDVANYGDSFEGGLEKAILIVRDEVRTLKVN